MTSLQDSVLLWTVRLSLALMCAAWLARLWDSFGGVRSAHSADSAHTAQSTQWTRRTRWLWSVGAGMMIVHICAAFAFVHQWSHATAARVTAAETLEVTGSSFGGGVWFNYVFLMAWVFDAIWWWLAERNYLARSRWIDAVIYGFLAFIAFQATVVFETGAVRWAGLLATGLLLAFWLVRRTR